MLWAVIILLALILCVMLGLLRVVALVLCLGIVWACFAILGRNNPSGANEAFLWFTVGLFLFAFVAALFSSPNEKTCPRCAEKIKWKADVCKHCGHDQPEQEPRLRIAYDALISQFDLRRWKSMTVSEYAGAGVMVVGVAILGFLTLYFLTPQ